MTNTVEKESEGDQFKVKAKCLQATANELQTKLREEERRGGPGQSANATKMGGYLYSTVIIRAFATECALKSLSAKRTGTYKRCHDLLVLYEALEEDVKRLVQSIADAQGARPPQSVLKEHACDFIEWRYPTADDKTLSENFEDMAKTLQGLVTTLDDPRFHVLCH